MEEGQHYEETKKYRCLEYRQCLSEDLYLMLCGLERCTADKSYGPTSRAGYHLHIVLDGAGTIVVDGKKIPVHAGQMFLEKPGEAIYYYPDEKAPWTYCWVTFGGNKAADYMEQAGFSEGVNIQNSYVDIQKFYELVDAMMSRPELTLCCDLNRMGLLYEFVGLAVESYSRHNKNSKGRSYTTATYVDYAVDFIRNNYANIRVSDISEYINISRSYLSNIFRQQVGMSPQDYLSLVRMRKGMQLLAETHLAVKQISEIVGYDSPLTFSRAFKNACGISPKQYRALPEEKRPVLQLPDAPDAER